jgi:hypothetical protein
MYAPWKRPSNVQQLSTANFNDWRCFSHDEVGRELGNTKKHYSRFNNIPLAEIFPTTCLSEAPRQNCELEKRRQ